MTFVRRLSCFLLFVFISIFLSISAYDWSVVVPWMIRLNTGM